MFSSLWTAPLLGMLLAAPVPDEATALLARAIKAQGGDEKLTKAQGATWSTKGILTEGGVKVDITGDIAVQSTDLIRWNATMDRTGRSESGVLVITPEKMWAKETNGEASEAPADAAYIRDVFRTVRLSQNLVFLRRNDLKISHLAEMKIDDRPVVGLKIAAKDHVDVDLFFDKTTSLPLRAEMRVKESRQTNESVYSFYFSDYKEVNGMQHFTRVIFKRDDMKMLEFEFSDFKFQEKLDPALFAKP